MTRMRSVGPHLLLEFRARIILLRPRIWLRNSCDMWSVSCYFIKSRKNSTFLTILYISFCKRIYTVSKFYTNFKLGTIFKSFEQTCMREYRVHVYVLGMIISLIYTIVYWQQKYRFQLNNLHANVLAIHKDQRT